MSRENYPECEKLAGAGTIVGDIVEFLAWLHEQRGFELVAFHGNDYESFIGSHESLVHDFLGIDGKKLEAERREILREASGGQP